MNFCKYVSAITPDSRCMKSKSVLKIHQKVNGWISNTCSCHIDAEGSPEILYYTSNVKKLIDLAVTVW